MSVSLIQGTFSIWGFYAAQPYLLELLRRDAVWVAGIITALMALATNAGNLAVELLARFRGRRTTLLIAAATALAIAATVAGLADSFWTVLLMMLLLNAAQGVGGPVQRRTCTRLLRRRSGPRWHQRSRLWVVPAESSDNSAWAGSHGHIRLPVGTSLRD
jgi:MFS family permease